MSGIRSSLTNKFGPSPCTVQSPKMSLLLVSYMVLCRCSSCFFSQLFSQTKLIVPKTNLKKSCIYTIAYHLPMLNFLSYPHSRSLPIFIYKELCCLLLTIVGEWPIQVVFCWVVGGWSQGRVFETNVFRIKTHLVTWHPSSSITTNIYDTRMVSPWVWGW